MLYNLPILLSPPRVETPKIELENRRFHIEGLGWNMKEAQYWVIGEHCAHRTFFEAHHSVTNLSCVDLCM